MVIDWIKQNRGLSAIIGASLVGLALAGNEIKNYLVEDAQTREIAKIEQAKNAKKLEDTLMNMRIVTVVPQHGDTWTGLGAKYANENCLENTPYGKAVMQVNGLKSLKGLQAGRPYYILTTNETPSMTYGSYKNAVAQGN